MVQQNNELLDIVYFKIRYKILKNRYACVEVVEILVKLNVRSESLLLFPNIIVGKILSLLLFSLRPKSIICFSHYVKHFMLFLIS